MFLQYRGKVAAFGGGKLRYFGISLDKVAMLVTSSMLLRHVSIQQSYIAIGNGWFGDILHPPIDRRTHLVATV